MLFGAKIHNYYITNKKMDGKQLIFSFYWLVFNYHIIFYTFL